MHPIWLGVSLETRNSFTQNIYIEMTDFFFWQYSGLSSCKAGILKIELYFQPSFFKSLICSLYFSKGKNSGCHLNIKAVQRLVYQLAEWFKW
jgi:hypothetical protein